MSYVSNNFDMAHIIWVIWKYIQYNYYELRWCWWRILETKYVGDKLRRDKSRMTNVLGSQTMPPTSSKWHQHSLTYFVTYIAYNFVTNITVADFIPESDQLKSALSCSTYQRYVFISSTAVINILFPVRRKLTPKIKLLNIHKMTQLWSFGLFKTTVQSIGGHADDKL